MKICFVLPKVSRSPIGGYKVVFQYADWLVRHGHSVEIHYMNNELPQRDHIPDRILNIISNFYHYYGMKWFRLDRRIKSSSGLNPKYRPNGIDLVLATSVVTPEYILKRFPDSKKGYFIQDYEIFSREESYVHYTYSLDFDHIVISNWLKKLVDSYSSSPSFLAWNGIDNKIYRNYIPYASRQKHSICFLVHRSAGKGFDVLLQVVLKLVGDYPDLSVNCFGTCARPESFPASFNYIQNASTEQTVELYNASQLFLCATIREGWGLTCMEAMSCGCCLVSTAYDSLLDFASNGENALLSPVGDTDALYRNAKFALDHPEEASKLSRQGIETAKKFDLDQTSARFQSILERIAS